MDFVRISRENGRWLELCNQWRDQCLVHGEEWQSFEVGSLSVLRELAEGPEQKNAGVFGLLNDAGAYDAICQLNSAMLPKTTGVTLRVRMMLLSPDLDFGDYLIEHYSQVLGKILYSAWEVSNNEMPSDHIKFHLRSPADREFFSATAPMLAEAKLFKSVQATGSWLYISK